MSITMERIRLVLMSSEEIRAALRLRAARLQLEMSEAAEEILRAELAPELEELFGDKDHPKPKKKP